MKSTQNGGQQVSSQRMPTSSQLQQSQPQPSQSQGSQGGQKPYPLHPAPVLPATKSTAPAPAQQQVQVRHSQQKTVTNSGNDSVTASSWLVEKPLADTPLQDREAEQGVLSLAFEDVEYYSRFAESGVTAEWFFDSELAQLYHLFERTLSQPGVTGLTDLAVREAITRSSQGNREQTGALLARFNQVIGHPVLPSYASTYQQRLLVAYQRRLQYEVVRRMAMMVFEPGESPERINSFLEERISQVRRAGTPIELTNAHDLAEETAQIYQERLDGINLTEVMAYELDELNSATDGGARRQELTLVSAPPKVGKTALVQRQAKHFADAGKVVVYFSLEMPKLKWMGRVLQQETGIPATKLERGTFATWKMTIFDSLARMADTHLYIVDDPMTTTDTIKRTLEHVRRVEGQVDVVMIDYVQLLRDRLGDDNQTARYVANELTALPKRFDCHVYAISNLNKSGELYGTVFLQYGCDNWWIVKNDKATEADKSVKDKSGEATIELKYQRYGNSGQSVPVWWNAKYTRFTDMGNKLIAPEMRYGSEYR